MPAEVTIDTLNFSSGTSINLATNTTENRITINTNLNAGTGIDLTVDSSVYTISVNNSSVETELLSGSSSGQFLFNSSDTIVSNFFRYI